ncbi:MAG: lactate 2-monooxygenase, partial [Candidatus Promineifilaceae bacterium]|nr:lactate 2-monooxygenase [Candidatus Promineifilaceae bacterium]
FIGRLRGRRPGVPADMLLLEAAAMEEMSPEAFAYVAGGAATESTMAANRASFERWRIVPRVLRDVSQRDMSVELFGERLPTPLLLAPIGVLEMAHPEADLAVARAAAAERVPFIFSSQASVSMEATAAAMADAPRWFQLYWSTNDDLVASFVRRAEESGCSAIVLTLDTTMLGWRPRDLDLAYLPFLRGLGIAQYTSDPIFQEQLDAFLAEPPPEEDAGGVSLDAISALISMARRYPGGLVEGLRTGRARAAVQQFIATYSRPSLTWDDLAFLRDLTELPILLKGILHPDDAKRALDAGMDGIIVSNHGGRQVDGAIGAAHALPDIADAVAGRLPVLFDSGIRGGADIFKALALGADAVCLGRPYVYGLALAGEQGVREVIQNVLADFDLTMGLGGCTSVAEIGRENLVRLGEGE